MHSPEAFVSMHAPIGGKRETKGNETGNEQETKRGFLYKTGNGPETRYGNEAGVFRRLRFHPENGGKDRSAMSEHCLILGDFSL